MVNFISERLKRPINRLVIHCSATPPHMDVGVKVITAWHLQRGFRTIGYHGVIRRDGTLEMGRPLESIGAHVQGHNDKSIGICLVGGVKADNIKVPENNFTPEQWETLKQVVMQIRKLYSGIMICGHRDLDKKKACPSFDVKQWLEKDFLK